MTNQVIRNILITLCLLCSVLIGVNAQQCQSTCLTPDCSCPRNTYPMPTRDIPQIVYFGFDDAVNIVMSSLYERIFTKRRKNPNGCRMKMSLYVSHQYTDYKKVKQFYDQGNEIGVHSVTHTAIDNDEILRREAKEQKENIMKAGIPEEDIVGWRSPFLKTAGTNQPQILKELGFDYDISLTYTRTDISSPKPWPFTMDHGWPYTCGVEPCPVGAQVENFWAVPVNSFRDHKNTYPCPYVDGCAVPALFEQQAYDFLWKNFMSYYNTTRAPFGLNMHAAWFYRRHNLKAMMRFLDDLMKFDDIYVVTVKQMLDWMRHPTPVKDIDTLQSWQCAESRKRKGTAIKHKTTIPPSSTPRQRVVNFFDLFKSPVPFVIRRANRMSTRNTIQRGWTVPMKRRIKTKSVPSTTIQYTTIRPTTSTKLTTTARPSTTTQTTTIRPTTTTTQATTKPPTTTTPKTTTKRPTTSTTQTTTKRPTTTTTQTTTKRPTTTTTQTTTKRPTTTTTQTTTQRPTTTTTKTTTKRPTTTITQTTTRRPTTTTTQTTTKRPTTTTTQTTTRRPTTTTTQTTTKRPTTTITQTTTKRPNTTTTQTTTRRPTTTTTQTTTKRPTTTTTHTTTIQPTTRETQTTTIRPTTTTTQTTTIRPITTTTTQTTTIRPTTTTTTTQTTTKRPTTMRTSEPTKPTTSEQSTTTTTQPTSKISYTTTMKSTTRTVPQTTTTTATTSQPTTMRTKSTTTNPSTTTTSPTTTTEIFTPIKQAASKTTKISTPIKQTARRTTSTEIHTPIKQTSTTIIASEASPKLTGPTVKLETQPSITTIAISSSRLSTITVKTTKQSSTYPTTNVDSSATRVVPTRLLSTITLSPTAHSNFFSNDLVPATKDTRQITNIGAVKENGFDSAPIRSMSLIDHLNSLTMLLLDNQTDQTSNNKHNPHHNHDHHHETNSASPQDKPKAITSLTKPSTVSMVSQSKYCTQGVTCHLPSCFCQGNKIPNGLKPKETPQMIVITIDGSVSPRLYQRYKQLFNRRWNPNDCRARGTIFATESGSNPSMVRKVVANGAEIAMQGLHEHHYDTVEHMEQEIIAQKRSLIRNGVVGTKGWKTPELKAMGNDQFSLLKKHGFLYDSTLSMTSPRNGASNPWPFTLDYGFRGNCVIPECPTRRFPGVWEVPSIPVLDYKGMYECAYVDGCMFNPPSANATETFLWNNFLFNYKSNKSPFGIHLRQLWFSHNAYKPNIKGLKSFLDKVMDLKDVFLVSTSDVIEWIQNPTPLNSITNKIPWNCS